MPFDPDEKLKATKVDLDELGLHLEQLPFDDENSILVLQMDLDENGDFMYDLDIYGDIILAISKAAPSNLHVLGLLPGIGADIWSKEDLQNHIAFLQKFLDTL